MRVYTSAAPAAIAWPAPMEQVYQALSGRGRVSRRPGRARISRADRLFMAAVVATPRETRYGAVTWVAGALAVSRQTVYEVAASVLDMLTTASGRNEVGEVRFDAPQRTGLSETALARAALTLLLPGGVTLRPMSICMDELLGERRSPAWLSAHLNEAGRRAGQVLAGADWSGMAPFIATRDEKFFNDRAYLLTIHPESLAVVSGHVEDGVDSERWAVSLGLDQLKTQGAIIGLAEDAANWYPASLAGAATLLSTPWLMPVQKDTFHVLKHARQTLTDVERVAFAKLTTLYKKLPSHGSGPGLIRDPKGYPAARRAADHVIQVAQEVHFWVHRLHDAFEVVDPRSGEIRDPDTPRWYLDQILAGLGAIDDRRASKLEHYIANQKAQLFTFLDWLDVAVTPWRAQAHDHFGLPELVQLLERAAARAWRLRHAVNLGRRHLRQAAHRAEDHLSSLCQHDPVATRLAGELAAILEMTVRTSSASECVNSVLELYLHARKSFQGRLSAQNFLNLFMLWFGLHHFQRGKRRDRCPFEIAGVKVFDPHGKPTDDWLAALGYPKTA